MHRHSLIAFLHAAGLSGVLYGCAGGIEPAQAPNEGTPVLQPASSPSAPSNAQDKLEPASNTAPAAIGAQAQYERGLRFQKGDGVKQDDQAAAAWFLKAAEAGHVKAQLALANAYLDGKGVGQDSNQAVKWFTKAAEQGDVDAQAMLGALYSSGKGVSKNSAEAATWLRRASEQGHTVAQYSLAGILERGELRPNNKPSDADLREAVRWYREAATRAPNVQDPAVAEAYVDSCYRLANMYYSGRGIPRDYAESAKWYLPAAERGIADAQYALALQFDLGQGVESNPTEAATLYRKAHEQGHARATNFLGWLYFEGRGVTKDEKEAVRLFQLAADKGYAIAWGSLGYAHEYGVAGLPVNAQQALNLYKKAGGNWATKRHARLSKRVACEPNADTKLFDAKLKCADRSLLRHRAAAAGAEAKRENDNDWGDTYRSTRLLTGSTELYVGYTFDDWFAVAEYRFPGGNDQFVEVVQMVASKYGKPGKAEGDLAVGPVSATWTLKDGLELRVHRGWPDTTVFLVYKHPQNFAKMKAEQAKIQRDKDAARYRAESRAF